MNDWQATQQLEYLVESAVWPESPGDPLFRRVFVSNIEMEEVLQFHPPPVALVRLGSGSPVAFRQEEIYEQTFEVEYATSVSGDKTGRADLIGKDRTSGTSKGRGNAEYTAPINAAIANCTDTQGITFHNIGSRFEAPIWLGNKGNVHRRVLTYSARVTQQKTYPGVPQGNWRIGVAIPNYSITWDSLLGRFDFFDGALVRKSGSPPTSETDGTVLTLPADWRTGGTYVDTPPTGSIYYGFFAGYRDYIGASTVYTSTPDLLFVEVS